MKKIWRTRLQYKGKESLKLKVEKIKRCMLWHVVKVFEPPHLGVNFYALFVISLLQERGCHLWNLLRGCQVKSKSQRTKIWNPEWVFCLKFSLPSLWLAPRETVSFVSLRPSMFPEMKPRETLRSRANKTSHCFPLDQSLRNRLLYASWLRSMTWSRASRKFMLFSQGHVTWSPPIGKHIWVGK